MSTSGQITPEQRAAELVPGRDRIEVQRLRYPDNPEVQLLAARAQASSDIAELAMAAAFREFENLRELNSEIAHGEPLTIRDAQVANPE
jgi:hypothetical protein